MWRPIIFRAVLNSIFPKIKKKKIYREDAS